ncbi:MAG: DUF3050 domain-containing protein [Planctomycetes bacterium]|nr:DUF3050 domain-containing protein [Planctomycetota bacterium]
MTTDRLARIQKRLEKVRRRLLEHPVYGDIVDLPSLRLFMEHHVFAVWDFMSLLKGLQRKLTCIEVPWVPTGDRRGRRLVNEIVMAEESDEDGRGGFASHYEMYHHAMRCCGADTRPVDRFLERLRDGVPLGEALEAATVAPAIRHFVGCTFEIVGTCDPCAMASAFTFGREDLLPEIFLRIVTDIDAHFDGQAAELRYYLQRHIELDGDEHGPMAMRLIESLCGGDEANWSIAEQAAVQSLEARLILWDGIHQAITADRQAATA